MGGDVYCGTLNLVLFLPLTGEKLFVTDSRVSSVRYNDKTRRNEMIEHNDLHTKMQIIGPFVILPSGSANFAWRIINNVREIVGDRYLEFNLQKLGVLFEHVRGRVARDKSWKDFAKGSSVMLNASFILGSTVLNSNGDFAEKYFVKVDSQMTLSDKPDTFFVSGCPLACKAAKKVFANIDFSQKSREDATTLIVRSFACAYVASEVVGGALEVVSTSGYVGEDNKVCCDTEHNLILPELYCALNDIEVVRLGADIRVSDKFLRELGILRENIGLGISRIGYSHSVDVLLSWRIHSLYGEEKQVEKKEGDATLKFDLLKEPFVL